MKKLILSLMVLCFALTAMAEPVGRQAAIYTAQSYMLSKGKQVEASPVPVGGVGNRKKAQSSDSFSSVGEGWDEAFYIFNAGNDEGYVIVSGDDRTEPILGYVDHGSFDPENIPENMKSWLQLYADQIKFIIDNNIDANSPILRKRNKVISAKHSVPELLTTRWNQGLPYNLTCPNYYTDKDNVAHKYPATGCTATAMAQVMNFYKYPEKTKAIIPAHSNTYTLNNGSKKTVTVKAVPRNTPIDWENMRDIYECDENHAHTKQDSAVANLMLYCGQAVYMAWGPSSGANFSAEAYIKYFGFDNSAYVGERGDYCIDDWFDMLYNEIEQGYPVLFSGYSSGGGHAFVLDGFDGDNLFHVNWGWGGGSNGWFLVGILNPGDNSGIGASSSSDGYSMGQRALFNLRLPDNNTADTYLFIKDVSISGTSIRATFQNRTGSSGNFHVAIVKQDDDGGLSVVGSQQTLSSLANDASQTKSISIRNKLPAGTYRLSPASKSTRSTVWRPKFNLRNHYIEAVVDSAGNVKLNPVDIKSGNKVVIDTIVFPGTRIVEQQQEVRVTYRNMDDEYFKEILMYASIDGSEVYTESRSMVAVRKGESVEVSYFFKPTKTGTYTLRFCTGWDGSGEVGKGTMEVVTAAQAETANLSVTSYTITNLVSGFVYGKQLVGYAKIKNNKREDFHGRIRLTIWNMPSGSSWAYGGSSQTYDVDIMAGKIATVDFSFDGLSENNKYYIAASYANQDGDLGNGGIWDLGGWDMKSGVALWKNDGTPTGKAWTSSMTTATGICGVYADCSKKINRMSPNKNPNTIYAFGQDMELPSNILESNVVHGSHADNINLVNDHPFFVPATFDADSASFTYTFPEIEDGTRWHAFTMPFEADSIFLDDEAVSLEDTANVNHFWIYEFTAQGDNGEIIFAPAKVLRGATPYIIAADKTMAGRSLVFRSLNVPFYKTGTDKMVVSTSEYKFHGNTLTPKVKDCYVLNNEGTAFEYVTLNTPLTALASYFTTSLPDSLRLPSIVLPDIPVMPIREATLNEASSAPIVAGTYDQLTLKRTFEAGVNTICLPFKVDNVAGLFGQDAQAYEFYGLTGREVNFVKVDALAAGVPYLVVLSEAITEDIVLNNVTIDEESTQAGVVDRGSAYFRGTYHPTYSDMWSMELRKLNADGTIEKFGPDETINGFRAFLYVPTDEDVTLHLWDDATGLKAIDNGQLAIDNYVYDLQGRKIVNRKLSNYKLHGVYIINGKKVSVH